MTYREALKIQIHALDNIYDNAEALRDCTDYDNLGKDAWNLTRGRISEIIGMLRKHNGLLKDKEAYDVLKGDYSIKVTIKDI